MNITCVTFRERRELCPKALAASEPRWLKGADVSGCSSKDIQLVRDCAGRVSAASMSGCERGSNDRCGSICSTPQAAHF